jgi:hypothetical protein
VEWIEKNYPLQFKNDPVPAWRKRTARLRGEGNPHKALKMYRSFMDDTAALRDSINESTGAVDQMIDEQIERGRMERAFTGTRE